MSKGSREAARSAEARLCEWRGLNCGSAVACFGRGLNCGSAVACFGRGLNCGSAVACFGRGLNEYTTLHGTYRRCEKSR